MNTSQFAAACTLFFGCAFCGCASAGTGPVADAGADSATVVRATLPLCNGEPVCIANAASFTGYRMWQKVPLPPATPDVEGVHTGPRSVYVNYVPAKGTATEFPIGTVIVKEMENNDDIRQRRVFATVKRGGDYNTGAVLNWEWFEITPLPNGQALIKWRGVNPPEGESYSRSKEGGCNGCHMSAKDNDFIMSGSTLSLR
jgi:Cytochrome P460